MTNATHVKILLSILREDGTSEVESLWAVPDARGYRIDNIPFYAREIAYGDVVSANVDEDGTLQFKELIEPSGHSTLRLWFADEQSVKRVRDELRQMGCTSELDLARLVALDVPGNVPYGDVRSYLDRAEADGLLEYEEACLGQSGS